MEPDFSDLVPDLNAVFLIKWKIIRPISNLLADIKCIFFFIFFSKHTFRKIRPIILFDSHYCDSGTLSVKS